MFTSVPDASDIFRGSIVADDNEVKIQTLCVDPDVINNEGSVSAAVATSMSRNVRAVLGCDVGLAITGVTGAPAEGQTGWSHLHRSHAPWRLHAGAPLHR